jgi:large subunit ribosomal protein L30
LTEDANKKKCIAAVRIRGTLSALREARVTLELLHLSRNNYGILVNNDPSFLGMLRAVQGFVTWGEPTKETVTLMVKERSRLVGNKKLADEKLQKMGYKSMDEFADAIFKCKVDYWKLKDIQPVFKLHPPTKGFKGKIKKSYLAGGELAYRGDHINDLLRRML